MPVGRRLARLAALAKVWWTGWFEPRLTIAGGDNGGHGCSGYGNSAMERKKKTVCLMFILIGFVLELIQGTPLYRKLGHWSLGGLPKNINAYKSCRLCLGRGIASGTTTMA